MGNGSSSDTKKKPKKKSESATNDSKKLAYKRQFSLDDAREKQQTLLDFYSSSSYGIGGSPGTGGGGGGDGKTTEEKIQDNINKAGNYKFSPGIKLAQDEEHYDVLGKKEQLNDPRRKSNIPNASIRPSASGATNLDINKIVTTLPQAAELQEQRSQANETYDPNGPHERPIVWGYCELTRKQLDEDQAAFATWTHENEGLVHAWAVFDGHGGYEVALYCAQHFLKYVEKYHKTRKNGVQESEWPKLFKDIFVNFDKHIGTLSLRGGCTVVIVLLVQYRLIIANAGDARAIMSKWDGKAGQLSYDHTPMADYDRVVRLVKTEKYNAMISKYFRINDKHETLSDIQKLPVSEVKKAPLISRELEKSRLLATIGVARGFGDFNLVVFGFRNIPIKPFLSCEPWVNIVELKENEIGETDCLVIACDGVYDVLQNQDIIDKIRFELFFDQEMLPKRLEKNKSKSISKTMTKSKSKSKSKDKDSQHNKDASIDFVPAKAPRDTDTNNNDTDSKIDSPDSIGNSSGNLRTATIKDPAGKVQTIALKPLSYGKLDEICNDLGRLAYKKGTVDDVSVFLIPLKQVFNCVH